MQRLLIGWILFGLSLGFTGQSWAGAEYQEFVLQNAVVATANGASMPVTKYTTVALDVTIATTATVTFEGSVSGDAWTSIACTAINTGVTTTAPTATGLYQCNVAGLSAFRARVSSWTAGAVTVYARATTAETGGIFAFLASVFDYVNTALRVTLATLISGEDPTNNLLMTSGGVARMTTFSSVTSATTSSVSAVPMGAKTFVAQIINATSETKAATLTIYGNLISSTTGGIALCIITLPSTATTLQLQDSCPITSVNFLYYFYTATVYTSASSAPLTVYASY